MNAYSRDKETRVAPYTLCYGKKVTLYIEITLQNKLLISKIEYWPLCLFLWNSFPAKGRPNAYSPFKSSWG